MNNLARRIERTLRFPFLYLKQIFKHLAQHFGIDSNLLLQRFGFVDREVVAIENVEDAGACVSSLSSLFIRKQRVWQNDVGVYPVVAVQRIEEATLQKRYLAVEVAVVIIFAVSLGQGLIEERLKHVVEEIDAFAA